MWRRAGGQVVRVEGWWDGGGWGFGGAGGWDEGVEGGKGFGGGAG